MGLRLWLVLNCCMRWVMSDDMLSARRARRRMSLGFPRHRWFRCHHLHLALPNTSIVPQPDQQSNALPSRVSSCLLWLEHVDAPD